MAHASGGGCGERPDRLRPVQKVLARNGAATAAGFASAGLLGEDKDLFVDVAQDGIGGGAPRAPGGRTAGAAPLGPDDLAPHLETDVEHVLDEVSVQRHVGLAPEGGDVDGGA